MNTVLFPYETLSGDQPALTIGSLRLDGIGRTHLIKKEESVVHIYDEPKTWRRAIQRQDDRKRPLLRVRRILQGSGLGR